MTVFFHPKFAQDVLGFQRDYAELSVGLGARFRDEINQAIETIKRSPHSAGHFLNQGSSIVPEVRRRNLRAFPFFILYGFVKDDLIFGAVIPSRSDPLTWLKRFRNEGPR